MDLNQTKNKLKFKIPIINSFIENCDEDADMVDMLRWLSEKFKQMASDLETDKLMKGLDNLYKNEKDKINVIYPDTQDLSKRRIEYKKAFEECRNKFNR